MVDEEVVMGTIQKMKDSGLEDSIIISTLQDIGLNEEQAKGFIARLASGIVPKKPVPAEAPALKPQPRPAAPAPGLQVPPAMVEKAPELTPEEEKTITEAMEEVPAGAEGTLPSEKPAVEAAKPAAPMPAPEPAQPAALPVQPEAIAEKAAERVKYHIAEHAEEEAMRHAATQAVLGEQSRQLGEMQKTIKKIGKMKPLKMPAGTPPEIKAIAVELESLRKDVEETRALAATTRSLMEKILEVNRKILSRLP